MLEACRAPAAVIGIRRRPRRRAEPDNLSAYALLQPFPLDGKYSAISAAERMDSGHGPDKYVPVDWLVLMAASV